jgi:hypothetical protein
LLLAVTENGLTMIRGTVRVLPPSKIAGKIEKRRPEEL